KSGSVSYCLMAKAKRKKTDWKQWEKKEIPKSEWKCKKGPAENTCTMIRDMKLTQYHVVNARVNIGKRQTLTRRNKNMKIINTMLTLLDGLKNVIFSKPAGKY